MLETDSIARDTLAAAVMEQLCAAVPGSTARLRGSLASGTADALSDIDVLWIVPDGRIQEAVECLPRALDAAAPVESVRPDTDIAGPRTRLTFVRFAGLPLFWRLDLEIVEESFLRNGPIEQAPPELNSGRQWPYTESALMNAVLAVKLALRGDREAAAKAMSRAYRRVKLESLLTADLAEAIDLLAREVAALDPERAALAKRVSALAREYGGQL